jgi:hypothetical protein
MPVVVSTVGYEVIQSAVIVLNVKSEKSNVREDSEADPRE